MDMRAIILTAFFFINFRRTENLLIAFGRQAVGEISLAKSETCCALIDFELNDLLFREVSCWSDVFIRR